MKFGLSGSSTCDLLIVWILHDTWLCEAHTYTHTHTHTHTPCPSVYLYVCPSACRFPQSTVSLNQKWRASNCAADNHKWQDRLCTYNVTLGRVRANHCCSGKSVSVANCECVCVYSLRYPTCNAHSPYCHLLPVLKYFSTLSHKRNNFRKKKVIDDRICFHFLYNFCLKHFLV